MKIFATTTAVIAGLFLESSAQFLQSDFQTATVSTASGSISAASADWPKVNYYYSTAVDMEVFKLNEDTKTLELTKSTLSEKIDAERNMIITDFWDYLVDGTFGQTLMLYDFTTGKLTTSVPSWDACFTFDIPSAVNLKEKMDRMFKPSSDSTYLGKVSPPWSQASFDLIKNVDASGDKSIYVNEKADLEFVTHTLQEGTFYHIKKAMVAQTFTDAEFTLPACEGKKLVSGSALKQQSPFVVTI